MSIETKISELFKKNDCYYEWDEESVTENLTRIDVHVTWGDWKHDHMFLDYIMKQEGFTPLGETVTEEDGSDCYSATHFYFYRNEDK